MEGVGKGEQVERIVKQSHGCLHEDHFNREVRDKLTASKETLKVFKQLKTEVRAKVTWRTKGDTMLAKTLNFVKDISQFTSFTPSQT